MQTLPVPSIAWRGADRLDRIFVAPADWIALEADAAAGFVNPIDRGSTLARLLNGVVSVLHDAPLESAPAGVAIALDGMLNRLATRENGR